jgi:hypothetical protein
MIAALDPHTVVELTGNTTMADVADDARSRLERALAAAAD